MTLPDHLPILSSRLGRDGYPSVYEEREIRTPVDLCTADGRLAAAAVGWSRRPLVRANLRGHWLRKKRWNFWNWIAPRFVFSVTLADVDYAAFCQVTFVDFDRKRTVTRTELARPGSIVLPEHVERSVAFRGRSLRYAADYDEDGLRVTFAGASKAGDAIAADFRVRVPPGQESLNVVVPWTATRFQLNSKHNTLPCEGVVRVGGERYVMRRDECHGVQDFGRGVWPYRSFWNWAVATGASAGTRLGVNVGGKWTTGTGVNENGILLDGRLHKIMEDVRWDYDPGDWMRPWRVRAEHSGVIDLTLEPIVAHRVHTSVGVLGTAGVCCFGRWRGLVRLGGRDYPLRDVVGWAEEFSHRW